MGKYFLKTVPKLLEEALRHSKKTQLPSMAGSLAYTTVLSIAPLLAVLFYIFKLLGGLDYAYSKLMPFLLNILSEGTGEIVESHLNDFVRKVNASAVGWVGFAGLFVTSTLTYLNIASAFNRIWEVDRPRSIHHRIFRVVTLMAVGPVLLAASIAITTAIAAHARGIPFSGQFVAFLLSTLLFILVYALLPLVKIPLKTIALGSLLPAALLEIAKFGYAIYTKHIVTYSTFYGSFAAIPLFLLWIYIAWLITLFGAVWVRSLQLYEKGKLHG